MKRLIANIFFLFTGSLFAQTQPAYQFDRVYTGNQVSNTVSVIDPSSNKLLGEIKLGKPQPNVLTALYREESLVHGLRYCPQRRLLAAVSIGSNAVTFISTEDNKIIKTIYVGRSPHEPTFTPDGKQVWITIRGEAYISVIDVDKMIEIKHIPVSDGPGMISFSKNGKLAFVCSSFSPTLDIVNTSTYEIVKKIPVESPFSPNIFTSEDGNWIAMTHKDIGKVSIINPNTLKVVKVITTGSLTNHVTFSFLNGRLLMSVTVGGENCVKVFDVQDDFSLKATIPVGVLPHGLWSSPDGKRMYVGLEYADQVQPVNMENFTALAPIQIGQSPQALVYADNAVLNAGGNAGLVNLTSTQPTKIIQLRAAQSGSNAKGQLAIRNIGQINLVEQQFAQLQPNTTYTLLFSNSNQRSENEYLLNSFITDVNGKYSGQSTGLISTTLNQTAIQYKYVLLVESATNKPVLMYEILGD